MKSQKLVIVAILLMALALLLGIFVHYFPVLPLDILISQKLQTIGDLPHQKGIIYNVLWFVSWLGTFGTGFFIVWLGFSLFFWLFRYRRETLFCLLAPLAPLINLLIKTIVNRPRPTADLVTIIGRETDPGFPSGHVVFFTVFFGFIFISMFHTEKIPLRLRRVIGAISLLLIVLISFSRIYLGAHFATDVIGGYLVGLSLLCLALIFK